MPPPPTADALVPGAASYPSVMASATTVRGNHETSARDTNTATGTCYGLTGLLRSQVTSSCLLPSGIYFSQPSAMMSPSCSKAVQVSSVHGRISTATISIQYTQYDDRQRYNKRGSIDQAGLNNNNLHQSSPVPDLPLWRRGRGLRGGRNLQIHFLTEIFL